MHSVRLCIDLDRRCLIYSVVLDSDVVSDVPAFLAFSWESEYNNILYVCICEVGRMQSCMRCVGALEGLAQQWHMSHQVTSPVPNSKIHLLKPCKQLDILLGRNSGSFSPRLCSDWKVSQPHSYFISFLCFSI